MFPMEEFVDYFEMPQTLEDVKPEGFPCSEMNASKNISGVVCLREANVIALPMTFASVA